MRGSAELEEIRACAVEDVPAQEGRVITVHGRPVADLVPINEQPRRQRFVPWDQVQEMFDQIEPDPTFMRDVDGLVDQTIDWPEPE